jgi:hypothetical protein
MLPLNGRGKPHRGGRAKPEKPPARIPTRRPGGAERSLRGAARALQREGAEALAGRMNAGRSRIPRDFRFAEVLYRWKEQTTRRQSTRR